MRTVEMAIYQYSELSDSAKLRAKEWYCEGLEYHWWNDAIKSVNGFCDLFGVTVRDYSIGAFNYSWIETNASNEHFRGWDKAMINALKDKNISGYYLDEVLTDALIEMYALNADAKASFNYAIDKAVKSIRDDWEYQYSDEAVSEMMEANQYEFDEHGKRI
jgi:hypothetical protein